MQQIWTDNALYDARHRERALLYTPEGPRKYTWIRWHYRAAAPLKPVDKNLVLGGR